MQNRLTFKGMGRFSHSIDTNKANEIAKTKPQILELRYCSVTTDDEKSNLKKILHPELIQLAMMNCEVNDETVDTIVQCKNLEILRLSQNKITASGLKKILDNLPNLERLDLTGNKLSGDLTEIISAYKNKAEKKLQLFIADNGRRCIVKTGIDYSHVDIDILPNLIACEDAECETFTLNDFLGPNAAGKVEIDVVSEEMQEADLMAELKKGVNSKDETQLILHAPTTEQLRCLPAFLNEQKKITSVQIRNYAFNGRKATPKVFDEKSKTIVSVDVSRESKHEGEMLVRNEDDLLQMLSNVDINSLMLHTCNIGPDEAKIISKNQSIVRLSLPCNQLGNKGFEYLMLGLPKLRFLNVSSNEFTDKRILDIRNLADIAAFELLAVRARYQVSEAPISFAPSVVIAEEKSSTVPPPAIKKRPSDKSIKCSEACERTLTGIERYLLKTNWKLNKYFFQGAEFIAEDKQIYRVPMKVLPQLMLINAERKKDKPDWKAACQHFYSVGKSAASKSKQKDEQRKKYYAFFNDHEAFIRQFALRDDAELVRDALKK